MLNHKYGDLNYISDQKSAIGAYCQSPSDFILAQATVSPEPKHSRPPTKYYFLFPQNSNHSCLY